MEYGIFILIALVAVFIISYRNSSGEKVYKYISKNTGNIYEKYTPYSFKEVRKKVKDKNVLKIVDVIIDSTDEEYINEEIIKLKNNVIVLI